MPNRRHFLQTAFPAYVLLWAAILGLGCWPQAVVRAQEFDPDEMTPKALAEKYVDAFCACAAAERELQLRNEALNRLTPDALKFDDKFPGIELIQNQVAGELTALLQKHVDELNTGLATLSRNHQQKELDILRKHWKELRTSRNTWDIEQSLVVSGQRPVGWISALLGKDTRWSWFWSSLAVLALVCVAWHDRRHEYRRMLLGSKGRQLLMSRLLRFLLAAMLLLTLVAFFFSERIVSLLTPSAGAGQARTSAEIQAELDRLTADCVAQEKELQRTRSKYDAAVAAWRKGDPNLGDRWLQAWNETKAALVASSLQQQIAQKMQADTEAVRNLQNQRAQHQAIVVFFERMKWGARAGVSGVLIAFVIGGGLLLFRGIKHRRYHIRNTCPMCLGEGTLTTQQTGSGGIGGNLPSAVCDNSFQQRDGGTTEKCQFRFLEYYRDMDRICFPTLGIIGAGKTHWITMVYHEIRSGKQPGNVEFHTVKSNRTDEIEELVKRLLDDRLGPLATQTRGLPIPLLFDLTDEDHWGRSNVLLTLFDYSGEVMEAMRIEEHAHRRRALSADGYLFFVDPTRPHTIQADALASFGEDLRVLGNVKSGRALRAPVALCLTKLDKLNELPNRSKGEFDWFYDELKKIDPSGDDVSLDVMAQRSQLTERLVRNIWPGWAIEGQVESLFGGRHSFFPMTPVGLENPDNLPTTGHGDRVFIPFGIHAPLLWLLHMNGYIVVGDRRT